MKSHTGDEHSARKAHTHHHGLMNELNEIYHHHNIEENKKELEMSYMNMSRNNKESSIKHSIKHNLLKKAVSIRKKKKKLLNYLPLRLQRVIKLIFRLVLEWLNQVEVLILRRGLAAGIGSISYITLLLVLTLYLYAVAGIMLFGDNDPWHFKSVEISMLTLLRVGTLDVSHLRIMRIKTKL